MIVIKDGLLIDPNGSRETEADILIDDTLVKDIAKPGAFSTLKGAELINARGCWVTPGLIDMHVHLREPGFEWKETVASGARAAVCGGFTTICCMPNTRPVNDHAEITKFIREKSHQAGYADVLPVGAVSKGLQGKEMAPFSELRKAGCVAFSDDGEPVYDSLLMRRALEWNRMLGTPILCHEEDKRLSGGGCMHESERSTRMGLKGMPAVSEEIMIARDIELARAFSARVHFCHVSTARSVELIRRAKADGVAVSAEATPHHLFLTDERVADYDTSAKMNPPLRQQVDVLALRAGLRDGTIDAIASDHAPHERDTKEIEFDRAAFGMIGLQSSLPLSLELFREGVLSRVRLVECYTLGPASVLGLRDRAKVEPGSRADLTIIDPEHEWIFSKEHICSLSANSPFLGMSLRGAAKDVIVSGKLVLRDFEMRVR